MSDVNGNIMIEQSGEKCGLWEQFINLSNTKLTFSGNVDIDKIIINADNFVSTANFIGC